jgi:transcriptional regulator with XRE-family HTH domain
MKLADVADDLGISEPYLSLLENSKRPLTQELILKLAEFYGVPASQLYVVTPHVKSR